MNFGIAYEVGTLQLSLYVLGLALGPMFLAPLSEYFGRSPVYIISYGIFLLYLLGSALVQNLGGFLTLRILSGMVSSVTIGESSVSTKDTGIRADDFSAANFGGTIADLWDPHDTGPAMSVFLWGSTCKSPVFNLFLFQLTF
jgi:MFS family permease